MIGDAVGKYVCSYMGKEVEGVVRTSLSSALPRSLSKADALLGCLTLLPPRSSNKTLSVKLVVTVI
jgi:hypothetical protein